MKRVLNPAVLALLVLVMCAGMLAPAASAETLINGQIPVNVKMTGSIPGEGDTVNVILTAVDNAPMPVDAKDGTASLEIQCDGVNNEAFFSIVYSELGIYYYTVTMRPGDHALGEYDTEAVYNVTVSVTNNTAYNGYEITVAAYRNGSEKKGNIEFENDYAPTIELTVVKKWVDQNSTRPSSVQIDLLRDGKVVEGETVTLNKKNDWQYTWTGLDSRCEWSVKEKKVPAGYTASYKFDKANQVWTVTNTGSLLQTGQLSWPIPVLVSAGILFVVVGLMLIRKRKGDNG